MTVGDVSAIKAVLAIPTGRYKRQCWGDLYRPPLSFGAATCGLADDDRLRQLAVDRRQAQERQQARQEPWRGWRNSLEEMLPNVSVTTDDLFGLHHPQAARAEEDHVVTGGSDDAAKVVESDEYLRTRFLPALFAS